MGWADVAGGVQNAVQRQLMQRVQQQQMEAQAQEHQRRAEMEYRSADRADRSQGLQEAEFEARNARQLGLDEQAAQQHTATQATALGDQLPPDTFLGTEDPAVGTMQRGGTGSLLTRQAPTEAMGPEFAGPMPNMESPQQAQVGRPGGYLKTRSQKQLDTDADNARMAQTVTDTRADKTADNVRRDAENAATADFRKATLAQHQPTDKFADWKQQYDYELAHPKKGGTGVDGPSPYAEERATRNLAAVKDLSDSASRWNTGYGSLLSNVPESDARTFAAKLKTLKANIAFGELTAMREASKTGGALGAISERELTLLESALGALDTGQEKSQFQAELKKIEDSIGRWHKASGGGTQGGMQRMQAPDGRMLNVPADKVAEMEAHGATRH
jgi:hypothetical protein